MVRVLTFVGLCAGTYVGVKALDNLVVWMAERREANAENFKLDREAAQLKQQLLREIQEKQATTGQHKLLSHVDKTSEISYRHLKQQYDSKMLNRNQEDKQHKLRHRQQDQQDSPKVEDIMYEQDEDQKLLASKLIERLKEDGHRKHSVKPLNRNKVDEHRKESDNLLKMKDDQKSVIHQPENCGGEIHAQCLDCGETFQIVEPVPHSPKSLADSSAQADSPHDLI